MENQPINTNLIYQPYYRKSSDAEDKQMLSIPSQRIELEEVASRLSLKTFEELAEDKSAFIPGREKFNKMIERIENGTVNALLVWQTNRIARNMKDGGVVIDLMDRELLKEIRTPTKIFTNTADDKFMLALEFTMAKKDSDDKSANVKRGIRMKLSKGQLSGMAPPGYLNITDPITKEKYISNDDDRFTLLQKALKLVASGERSPMFVLRQLNTECGFKTRKTAKTGNRPLAKSAFYRILNDEFYAGWINSRQGRYKGSHEPMITEEDFERIQIILGSKGNTRLTKKSFPYKKLLTCGGCNGGVTAEEKWHVVCSRCKEKFNRGRDVEMCPSCQLNLSDMQDMKLLHYVYLHCAKKVNPKCTQRSIEIKELENQIEEEILKFEIPEEFQQWAIKHLNEHNTQQVQSQNSRTENLHKQHQECVKSINNLLELKISPDNVDGSLIDNEQYQFQRTKLLNQKKQLEDLINDVNQEIEDWLELSEETFNFALYARVWLKHGTHEEKNRVLAGLGSNITIYDKELAINQRYEYFLIEEGLETARKIAEEFEPGISLDEAIKRGPIDAIRTSWLTAWATIGTRDNLEGDCSKANYPNI